MQRWKIFQKKVYVKNDQCLRNARHKVGSKNCNGAIAECKLCQQEFNSQEISYAFLIKQLEAEHNYLYKWDRILLT